MLSDVAGRGTVSSSSIFTVQRSSSQPGTEVNRKHMANTIDRRIDMHMHSTYSDGIRTPTELVAMAKSKGLVGLALTDHDSMEGFRELRPRRGQAGVEVMTGVELSCEYNGPRLARARLRRGSARTRSCRRCCASSVTRASGAASASWKSSPSRASISTWRTCMAKAGNGALGRPHIAEALIEAGYVADHAQAFATYIGEGWAAYVDKFKMQPAEAVANIHAADGLAFVAHPGYYMEDYDAFLHAARRGLRRRRGVSSLSHSARHHAPARHSRASAAFSYRAGRTSTASRDATTWASPPVSHALFERIQETLANGGKQHDSGRQAGPGFHAQDRRRHRPARSRACKGHRVVLFFYPKADTPG